MCIADSLPMYCNIELIAAHNIAGKNDLRELEISKILWAACPLAGSHFRGVSRPILSL